MRTAPATPRFTPNDTHAKKRPADLQVHEPFNHINQPIPQHRSPETDQGQITTWTGSRRSTSVRSTLVIGTQILVARRGGGGEAQCLGRCRKAADGIDLVVIVDTNLLQALND